MEIFIFIFILESLRNRTQFPCVAFYKFQFQQRSRIDFFCFHSISVPSEQPAAYNVTQQFSNVPPPSNLPAFQQYQPYVHQANNPDPNQFMIPTYNTSASNYPPNPFAQPPVTQSTQIQPQPPGATSSYQSPPTFNAFPQVQTSSIATPISLPGMPPLTVNTIIPPQQYEGMQFNPTTHHN